MNDSLKKTNWTGVRLPSAPQIWEYMENRSEVLKKATRELLEGVENFEKIFSNLVKNPIPELVAGSNYFLLRAEECKLLIILCNTALAALPSVTPPTSKIQRVQYRSVRSRLQSLVVSFGTLQSNLNILYPLIVPSRPLTSAEQATKASTLLAITSAIPGIIADLVFSKGICLTIEEAFEF